MLVKGVLLVQTTLRPRGIPWGFLSLDLALTVVQVHVDGQAMDDFPSRSKVIHKRVIQ